MSLPIEAIRADFETALTSGPVVITSPTGSGKSTMVPRWCAEHGRVLVVQPRRVAARSLAKRVAELEGTDLGTDVGFIVRGESQPGSRIVFATTGVVLRQIASGDLGSYDVVVIDELHERSLDLDLIFALVAVSSRRLVTMSATIDGDAVADHIGGTHLAVSVRSYPVDIHHLAGPPVPTEDGLTQRVVAAIRHVQADGDILVFLPGKGEIRSLETALRGSGMKVLPLHGGLSLREQSAVFAPSDRVKVILSTNVAETSVTIVGVGVVIDSGLVRRTRYHNGRGTLTLAAIAQDSADQRAGRAGRTGPGVCYRLWSRPNVLDPTTTPEMHRESLVPLLLAAAACGHESLDLPWLDPPKDYAVEDARAALSGLGALDQGRLTPTGESLFRMPVDPALGRLLVEAKNTNNPDLVDLVAGLHPSRPLFGPRPEHPEDDLRLGGCDAVARIRAVREGSAQKHGLKRLALSDAKEHARRLRNLVRAEPGPSIDRRALADAILRAWPDAAYIKRARKRQIAWGNGGTEVSLGKHSAVDESKVDALLLLSIRSVGKGRLKTELLATAAMPVPIEWLAEAGLGSPRLAGVKKRKGRVVGVIEHVYAGRVLRTTEEVPQGELAIDAFFQLIERGTLVKRGVAQERHRRLDLHARLQGEPPPEPFEPWLRAHLTALGITSGADLAMLEPHDLLPDGLEPFDQERLDKKYPPLLELPDATYRLEYHPRARRLVLHKEAGSRKKLPQLSYVPAPAGWKIDVVDKGVRRTLR